MPSAFLHPFTPPRKDEFLMITGGKGAVIWDDTGKEYIDGMASLWYVNVGHGREEIADALAEQARTLAAYHTFDPYTTQHTEDLAAEVAELSPFDEPRVFLGSSGSEAVDTVMKIARIAQQEAGNPHKQIIVSRERGYQLRRDLDPGHCSQSGGLGFAGAGDHQRRRR